MDLFRDTFVGLILRTVTRGQILKYPDELHPEDYKQCITIEKTLTADRVLSTTSTLQRWTTSRNPELQNIDSLMRPTITRGDTRPSVRRGNTGASRSTARQPGRIDEQSEDSNDNVDLEKAKTEADGEDFKIVNWHGEDDAANPQNWSFGKKLFVTGQVCFLTFTIYIGSAIYSAGELGVEQTFHVSSVVATLGLTMFVLGYGTGPMFIAPLAEAPAIGRSPVYILSVFSFVFLNFGVVYASNIGMLLAFRFITGFVGSPVLATGGSSLADMWSPAKRSYAIAVWGMFAVCGPVLGPLVGGFAAAAKGWTWPIWELIWLNGFCFVLLAFCLPETSSTTILYHRAQRLRKSLQDPALQTEAEIEMTRIGKKQILRAALWLPFRLTFTEPILLFTDLYLGLVYAVLYCWFEAFPIAFIGVYGFTLGENGLSFLGILVGAFLTVGPYCYYMHKGEEKHIIKGALAPEKRLRPALVGAICMPISLFWFGWTARASVHWIVPIIGSGFFSVGALLLFNAVLNYQGDAYPKYIGSVYAGNDLFRSSMGAGFPVFAGAMFTNLGLDWGCSLLGFLSIAFIPLPIILLMYGRRIRMASKFARHDI